MNVIFISGK